MKKSCNKTIVVIATIIILLLLAACAAPSPQKTTTPAPAVSLSPTPTSVQPQYGGILKRHTQTGPSTPIGWPVEGTATSTDPVSQTCLERLMVETANGELKPWLATSYKIADDKKSVTLTLRKGVKFHDGTDFNAKAAKFNFDAYITAKASAAATWSSVDIIDDYTIRVNLKEYRNTGLGGIVGLLQVSPTAVEKNGLDWARWNPVGTGPFKFVSFQRDVSLKFEKFKDYWQEGKPYLDGIELVFIQDFLTAQMAFKAGELHIFQSENSKMSYDLANEGYLYARQLPQVSGTLSLIPDSNNPDSPLSDKRVRQAIDYAIDREAIVKGTGYGFSVAQCQISPNNTVGYIADLPLRKYDPDMAKKLLAEAGFPNGFKTKIIADPRTTTRDLMVAIQSYLNPTGITVDLDFPENAAYTEYRYSGWKNGMMCQLVSNFATYTSYFSTYWAGNQFVSVKYPEGFRDLWKEVLATAEIDKDKVQKIVRLMFDDAMVIPISQTSVAWFYTKNVHDTGILTAHHSYWSPSTAWIEKGVGIK